MKCLNCGAEIKDGSKFCEFCGSSISADMKREQEYLNKAGCPKCGSSNVTFIREKQGEVKSRRGTVVVRATVGVCKDCGHTWQTHESQPMKKRKTWLWVLGWIFIFPIPLTILMLRKKDMNPAIKYGIIAAAWIIYLLIGRSGNSDNSNTANNTNPTESSTSVVETETKETEAQETEAQETAAVGTHIYDNAEVVDLMNGFGTEKIGTITVAKASKIDCTDAALIDWYFNYVKNHSDSNYHLIIYTDEQQQGVYTIGSGFIQKDLTLIPEEDGTYMTGNDAGSTYFTVDESAKTLTVQYVMADASIVADVKSKVDAVIPAEYKNSKLYSVDIAGEAGSFDCNLTLVNESFADADLQGIAVELATKVKDLDLGMGYFCISFQSDDYTLTAISNMDNLSDQDVSEISTKAFNHE